jgi:hypothetical protein
MVNSSSEVAARPSGRRFLRLEDFSRRPGSLGLAVAAAWVLLVALVHSVAAYAIGPALLPFGPGQFAWTILVNGALLGLVVAGHASLKLGVTEDLRTLRAILPSNGENLDGLADRLANIPHPRRFIATFTGAVCGLSVATLDPTLRDLHTNLSPFDPRYVLFLTQNILFAALWARLFALEVHMTRAYARLGEQVKVDLLDTSTLLAFGRKGLRSVTIWASFSMVFSMFWVLNSAGQANVVLAAAVLVVATVALVAPTNGVRRNIAAAKAAEIAIVSEAVRRERKLALAPRRADAPPDDARLGNLIQYQAFVHSVREWPFDLSIVSRSSLFILLGAGSWLGGAMVERLLNQLLG